MTTSHRPPSGQGSAVPAQTGRGAAREQIRRLREEGGTYRSIAAAASPRLRDAVTGLYDAWWDKRAPERTRAERGAATAARRRAIAGNWCAGAGLDDDDLDTPGYRPASNWKPATGTGIAPDIHRPVGSRKDTRSRKNKRP